MNEIIIETITTPLLFKIGQLKTVCITNISAYIFSLQFSCRCGLVPQIHNNIYLFNEKLAIFCRPHKNLGMCTSQVWKYYPYFHETLGQIGLVVIVLLGTEELCQDKVAMCW